MACLATGFLLTGLAIGALPASDASSQKFAAGTFLKVGVVLGLVWLSAPQLERFGWHRIRGTLLIAIVLVLVLWAIRPRIGAIAGAVLIVGSLAFSLLGWVRKALK